MMNWQTGLDRLVWLYLDEGLAKRGSLREAIELVAPRDDDDDDSDNGEAKDGEKNHPAKFYEDVSSHSSDDDDVVTTTTGRQGGHRSGREPVFTPLEVEKLKRNIMRWRIDLAIEKSKTVRVALSKVLKAIPNLLDILEPLADFWSLKLGKGSDICDQLMNSWTGELVGNLLCLYVGSAKEDTKVTMTCLCDVGEHIMEELASKNETSDNHQLEGSLFRLTELVENEEEIHDLLLPAMHHLCTDQRMERAAVLFFCKPYLPSKDAIERANYILCAPNGLQLPFDDESEHPLTLLNYILLSSTKNQEQRVNDRKLVIAALHYIFKTHDAPIHQLSTPSAIKSVLDDHMHTASTIGLGPSTSKKMNKNSFPMQKIKQQATKQDFVDNTSILEDELESLQGEMNHALVGLTKLILHKVNHKPSK